MRDTYLRYYSLSCNPIVHLSYISCIYTHTRHAMEPEHATTTLDETVDPRSVTTNPWTGARYSTRYFDILEKRLKLPIYAAKRKIQRLVQRYQVLLLVGETGSGKTTQVPQYLLELYPDKAIACTQPRRVAAMSVSERVANEMDVELGAEVGYCIRFDDMTSEKTRVKYLTDGMLLREAMTDPDLSAYSVIVLDEAHERTVSTDILIGCVKALIARRPDLRVVVMSATLEEKKFQKYFVEAPLIHISGRMYGVEVYFAKSPESNYVEAVVRTVTQIHIHEEEGDILVFLTGEDEIETTVERLRVALPLAAHSEAGATNRPSVILPLYSALPPGDQRLIFKPVPPGTRKIIVATNIAETSLTVDGVVFVVDSGFAKQKVFNPKLRVESLLVTPISQAAANQRMGRAGRTKPGKCFRMYTATSYDTLLQPQTYPEIMRSDLGSTVLQLKKIGIDDLVRFDFVDPPAPETLMRALELLNYLGALDDDGRLTPFGASMSAFPVEPEMAAMLMNSSKFRCRAPIAKLAAMMSVQNPFLSTYEKAAARAKEQFYHMSGDHLALLNIYQGYETSGYSGEWCKENFLNPRNMKQAKSVTSQLLSIMERLGIVDERSEGAAAATSSAAASRHGGGGPRSSVTLGRQHRRDLHGDRHDAAAEGGSHAEDLDEQQDNDDPRFANNIRRAILSGYFTKVALAMPSKNQYATLKDNVKALLFPATMLNRRPTFIVYNELVLTSNHYLRTVTSISDDWLLDSCPKYFDDVEEFSDGLVRSTITRLLQTREQEKKEQRVRTSGSDDEGQSARATTGSAQTVSRRRPR